MVGVDASGAPAASEPACSTVGIADDYDDVMNRFCIVVNVTVSPPHPTGARSAHAQGGHASTPEAERHALNTTTATLES